MATQLKDDQKLEREIKVYGVEAPVIVTLTKDGMSFRVKGTKTSTELSWLRAAEHSLAPGNVPSICKEAIDFLKHQANKVNVKRARRQG